MRQITDPRDFGRVAVLMGGTSSEREVSLNSGANVFEALRSLGVQAEPVDGIPALIGALAERRFDRVFNILHGHHGGGEDGVLQGLLDALNVPYTGSGVLGSALSMDKIRTKQVWMALGLPTPRYARIDRQEDVHVQAKLLGLPVIVKPACEGSSVGISRVFDDAGLDDAVALAARYPGGLLMEQLIVGEEFSVSILGDAALPSVRIVPAGEYYDYHAKYISDDTQYICPGLSGEEEAQVGALCLKAFAAVGCSGWSRVDVMRDAAGKFWLLEVNTAPGMTSHSLVPKAAKQIGIDFPTLCWRILETSFREGRPR
jgi:D-alanine-D-alanine ligase